MGFEQESDEALLHAIAQGDHTAFQELVQRHQNQIYGTIVRMVGYDEAEDLAQEVFIKVYRHAGTFKPEAKVTTWMLTICRNTVFSYFKKKRLRAWIPFYSESEEHEHEYEDPAQLSAHQQAVLNETEKTLQNALQELPEPQRMALILREYDQMDYEEIAKVLGTSVSAVKSLLFRGRETLKKKLSQLRKDSGV